MLHFTSVKTRLIVSVSSNAVRALLSFFTGLLIARGLNPAGYGDLMFLLGSFVAIRSLLDMGSSSAFYTFLSQHARGRSFYLAYFAWLALQFGITLALVALVIPSDLFERIWLGHNREIVMLAFVAAFMQQQVWQAVGQIGESMRKTVKVQLMNLSVAMIYLTIISVLLAYDGLTIKNILWLLTCQYIIATVIAHWFLKDGRASIAEKNASIKQMLVEYWVYCKPLSALAIVSFLYVFADNWMLQKFGGATQQGYFQIASQFAAISLLATTSILNVFWKEISDAWAGNNHARVAELYHKVSRGLVMLGAIVTGMLIPWSEQIVSVFLGAAYTQAWPVLAIMLLYPIHQSMGQIGGTMFLATGNTKKYMVVSIAIMLISIPFSYLVLAPASGAWVPGMELGALGMAYKMVLLGIVSVNIQAWVIARYSGWKFDWKFQVAGIPLMIGLGYFAKMLVGLIWNLDGVERTGLIVPVIIALLIYAVSVVASLWLFPWLIGLGREEIKRLFGKLKVQNI